jgi:predicted nucleotidyltransferase
MCLDTPLSSDVDVFVEFEHDRTPDSSMEFAPLVRGP